jgi:hypothetical protein
MGPTTRARSAGDKVPDWIFLRVRATDKPVARERRLALEPIEKSAAEEELEDIISN